MFHPNVLKIRTLRKRHNALSDVVARATCENPAQLVTASYTAFRM
jgi:hypothetical protein